MAKKKTSEGPERDLFRIASFIIFDAMLFHSVLANNNHEVSPFSERPAKLAWQKFLLKEWVNIRDNINYEPVFTLAIDVIKSLPTAPDTDGILADLAEGAEAAVRSGILLKHDFVGRIYHKLLLSTTGHYYATYYTSVPAAVILSNLLIKTPHPIWNFSAIEKIEKFRVIDPACGSGTLLSAAYYAVKDRYILSLPKKVDLDRLHEVLVAKVFHGWDVLEFAAHLTLTTLALHSNSVTTNASNVVVMRTGLGERGGVHLGSLDHLDPSATLSGLGLVEPPLLKGMTGSRHTEIKRELFDVVLMNPPFSRSAKPGLTFGYAAERKEMQKRLANIARELGLSGIGRGGLGPFFMILGLDLLNEHGRTGVVIPRSMLSGVSWQRIRSRYLDDCEIKYIVSNYDPGDNSAGIEPWNWSENTNLGEVLIVAEKTTKSSDERFATFVNLYHKPKNEVEALMVSQQIIRKASSLKGTLRDGDYQEIRSRGSLSGVCFRVPQSELTKNWGAPAVFAQPELNQLVLQVRGNRKMKKFSAACSIVGGRVGIGPDIAQVKGAFATATGRTSYPILLGHQADMNTIDLDSLKVSYGKPKAPNAHKLYEMFASNILVAERPHLSTEALLAMRCPERVLTTAFWEIHLAKDAWAPLLLLWLNSTFGILSYLSVATSSMGDIFKMKKDQLQDMPFPDPALFDHRECAKEFVKLSGNVFAPFQHEFKLAEDGLGARRKLDDFFSSRIPSLPLLKPSHYSQLARDPMITKQRL